MEPNNERPIIFAVVTVFLTFTLVYLAFFRKQSSSLNTSDSTENIENSLSGTLINNNQDQSRTGAKDLDTILNNDGWVDLTNKPSVIKTGVMAFSLSGTNRPLFTGSSEKPLSDINNLLKKKIDTMTEISPRYNSIKMAETFALDIKFAFSDTGTIQYGYLGTGSVDGINSIVKRLGGNIVAIETENDILKNSLRGDRVLFINIPQVTLIRANGAEKRLLVTFLVEIGSDKRLIQSPADRYYNSRQRMKSLFEKIYGKIL